jgi:hypothetical protein
MHLLRHRLYFRFTPSCRPSFASFTSLLPVRYRRSSHSSRLISRQRFLFSFFTSNKLAFGKMTLFSAALLRQRFNAVIQSIQSLRRLACRLSASISRAFFIEFFVTQRHCKTLFRLDSNSLLFPVVFIATSHQFHTSFHSCTAQQPLPAMQLLRHRLYFRLIPSCRPSFASFTSLLALRYRRSSHSSKLIPRQSGFFFIFHVEQARIWQDDAVQRSFAPTAIECSHSFHLHFCGRLPCRFSASPRPSPAPPSSKLPSDPTPFQDSSFDVIPTRYYFRFVTTQRPHHFPVVSNIVFKNLKPPVCRRLALLCRTSPKFPRCTAQRPLPASSCSDTDSTSA